MTILLRANKDHIALGDVLRMVEMHGNLCNCLTYC